MVLTAAVAIWLSALSGAAAPYAQKAESAGWKSAREAADPGRKSVQGADNSGWKSLQKPEDSGRNPAQETVWAIWEYEMARADASDYEEYLRVGLVPYAGTGAEWFVICLKEWRPELDYSAYDKALDEYLDGSGALKAVDYQRIGLVKSALGTDKEWIAGVIRDYTGSGGVMSMIYGVILANGGDYLPYAERVGLARELAGMQLADGGFAISGAYADVDVTAMALQALAPYREEFGAEIDRALQRLSGLQKDNGGFAGRGTENAESSAQALMALCALDIDYREDGRFIKNANTIWDAIEDYACEGGGFSHTRGGMVNQMATAQVLTAALCLSRYDSGKGFLYDFGRNGGMDEPESGAETPDETEPESGAETPDGTEPESGAETPNAPDPPPGHGFGGSITGTVIKIIIISFIVILALTALVVCMVRRRLGRFRALRILIPAALLIMAAAFSRIETREEHYGALDTEGEVRTYISVMGYDGAILSRRAIMAKNGGSVFDQLQSALAAERINVDYGGSRLFGNLYVRGIGGLSEFDHGSLSGWTYRVNGEYPNVPCDSFVLSENDDVEWIYTENRKKDGDSE